ncbi:MAG TPA: hypothetical protein VEK07_08675 [Polyangiaceae bacterium]|nr:hypothetical protein [Polyangiaceae bacterium]
MRPGRAETAWIAAGCGLILTLVWHEMAVLGDGFWCIAAGDFVLRHHAFPDSDPFSFTSRHVPWLMDMPAFQIGGAWLAAHFGLLALMAACTLPIASAAAILWLTFARDTRARLLAFPVALLYVLVDADDLSARGQAFGDLGLAVLIILLVRLRRGRRVHPLWPLLLAGVWANFHPSFVLAAALPVAFASAEWLEPRSRRAPVTTLLVFAGLAVVGACLNPASLLLFVDIAELCGDPTTARVDLFTTPDFRRPQWLLPIAVALVLLVVLARRAKLERARADAALLIGFVLAECMARRYTTMLVAFEMVLVAEQAAASTSRSLTGRASVGLAGAAAVQALLSAGLLAERKDPLRDVPAESVQAIERLGLPDHVLSPYHWGGYLDWVWAGRRKTFIDGRGQLFSNGVFDDAQRLSAAAPGARMLLDIYEIRTVLSESRGPLDRALSKDDAWREVHRDRLAALYVRR